jgi:formyl-CoA transferase
LAAKSAAQWERLLNAAGVPAGSVFRVEEALAHPQIADRGMIGVFEDPPGVGRDLSYARPGIKIDGSPTTTDLPPPELGQQTAEVLQELGYSAQGIEALRQANAI